MRGRIISLRQDPLCLHYRTTWPDHQPKARNLPHLNGSASPSVDDTEDMLRRYFSLNLDLVSMYKQWSDADANFRKKAPGFTGVRILSQDAWEALVCFICSSNNNIGRISQMVHKLCEHYGSFLGKVANNAMHDFPTPDALTGNQVESHLRELGFGYRAKYIAETARLVAHEKPAQWLESLRNPEHEGLLDWKGPEPLKVTYKEAHNELLSLAGVGPKVADCVCLMGLGWGESVPVDTHVWQIAQRDYKFGKTKTKTFNKVMYDAVGDHFRDIWGKHAGWAHSVLFTADLREFAAPKVKKEEALSAEEVEGPASKAETPRRRKRGATVEAEAIATIKVESSRAGVMLEAEKTIKRRRTRGRP
ncbi:8-oxoguanine DNA-glycosylase [Drechmeria coniospora]|uniref:DNA-(apurinic or apyrimidinic site) lyase n=1 Tax=Drechmeria coniospora TaxID=98403 RepID=A0A151GIC7_DRECN|nr:8-oxoguanine DNA-glycosylase [Drechmeria coniospora]KYK56850.1 8-oxoguanine DNA-glycosylase [Drechmeria coniospora]